MPTIRNTSINAGDGGIRIVTDILTLSSGTVTWSHGLRKFRIFVSPVDPSAIPAETFGVVGTPNVDGWLISLTGQAVIKSSNGSSAEKVFVMAIGDGA
jgi:hypothetical protein